MTDVEKLSASGIKKYKECEKSFWYKYLSNIPSPEEGKIEHFEVGNTVHDTIENVLKENPGAVDDEEELFELFMEEEDTLDYDYSDNDKVNSCFETASIWISTFVDDVKYVEEEWEMERDGINYKGFADLVADIRISNPDGEDEILENVIVDWKTGQENEEWKERIQSGMYIEMYDHIYGSYPEAAVFVYLDEEIQSMHRRVQDGEVFWNNVENKYWTEIEGIKNKILMSDLNDDWEAMPDESRCYFCDYKFHCRESGIGAEDVELHHFNVGSLW